MKKLLNYKSLLTILASVVVLFNVLIAVFKININIEAVISISLAVIGVLVSIGVVKKNKDDKTIETKEELLELLDEDLEIKEIKASNTKETNGLTGKTENQNIETKSISENVENSNVLAENKENISKNNK